MKDNEIIKGCNKYPCKTVVGNNSEIHSKTAKDYDNLIASIKAEAIKEFVRAVIDQIDGGLMSTTFDIVDFTVNYLIELKDKGAKQDEKCIKKI